MAGARIPHKRTLDRVALDSPKSMEVYQNRLWKLLLPETDLRICRRVFSKLGGAIAVEHFRARLLGPEPGEIHATLTDMDTLSRLVAAIRCAMADKSPSQAFSYGCLLAQVLAYLYLNTMYRYSCCSLWKVMGKGILDGLSDGAYIFEESFKAFEAFRETLEIAVDEVEHLSGGMHRYQYGESLAARTAIDLFHPHIRAFSTPGESAHVDLIDMLEHSKFSRTPHCSAKLERIEKSPLFITLASAKRL